MKLIFLIFGIFVLSIIGYFFYLLVKTLSSIIDIFKEDDISSFFHKDIKICEELVLEKIKGDLARKRIFTELNILKKEFKNKDKRETVLIQIRKIIDELKEIKVETNSVEESAESILNVINTIKGA